MNTLFSKSLGSPLKDPDFIVLGRHIYSCGHANSMGLRDTMEDAAVVVGDFAGVGSSYFAIYDGHGGSDVAKYCANYFHRIFASKYHDAADVVSLIKETIVELNDTAVKKWPDQGCTLAVLMIIKEVVYAANLGDTRIILIDNLKPTRVSYDHKASDPKEAELIKKKGGMVVQGRVCGMLALSRAIGDGALNDFLIREPTIFKTKRKDGMQAIIACDGVWDVMSDEEAAKITLLTKNTAEAARKIKDTALDRSTTDNVSVLVISLTKK